MTTLELWEKLSAQDPADDVLVCVNGDLHHYAVDSVSLGLGGCPVIHAIELPAGKMVSRAGKEP